MTRRRGTESYLAAAPVLLRASKLLLYTTVSYEEAEGIMVTRGVEKHFWIGPGTEGALTPSLPSSLAFVAALWLGFAPYVLHFSHVRGGLADGIDVLVALVVGILALIRTVVPRDFPVFSVVNAMLGLWLVVAPFVLGYTVARIVVVDLVVGVLLLGLSGLSAVLTYRQRAKERAGARAHD